MATTVATIGPVVDAIYASTHQILVNTQQLLAGEMLDEQSLATLLTNQAAALKNQQAIMQTLTSLAALAATIEASIQKEGGDIESQLATLLSELDALSKQVSQIYSGFFGTAMSQGLDLSNVTMTSQPTPINPGP